MHVLVEATTRVGDFSLPEFVDEFFRQLLSLEPNERVSSGTLDLAKAPDSIDDVYGPATEIKDIVLLVEAKAMLKAIKDGLERRLKNGLVEGEWMRFT